MAGKQTLNSLQEEEGAGKKQRITEKNKIHIQPETKIENCSSSALLQIDVVAEILSRLPAKSVAKFRCVCKQWLYLTRDPHFLKLQHERSSSCVLFNKCVRYGKIKLYDFNNGDGRKPAKSSYRLNIGRTYYKLSNFVDGLTCAYAHSEFARPGICLLNPMTRETLKLPMTTSRAKCSKHESVGLGIDMTEGKYKVVWLFSSSMSHRARCEIYTVGTAQWRCLGEAPFGFSYDFNSVLFHGALHWIGYVLSDNHQEGKFGLFRFSIKNETFGPAVSLPAHTFTRLPLYSLKVSGGKLWLIFNDHIEHYFEIWSMEDYVHGTWVKEYKFDNSCFCLSSVHDNYHLVEFADGELFLKYVEPVIWHVICYNPRNGVLRKLFSGKQQGDVAIYWESLISPKKLSEVTQSL